MEWRARICVSVCVGFLIWVRLRSGTFKGLYRVVRGSLGRFVCSKLTKGRVTVKNKVARVCVNVIDRLKESNWQL